MGTVLARLTDGAPATYLTPGSPLPDALPFNSFRLGVLAANGSASAMSWTPVLEFRVAGTGAFSPVPEQSAPGVPFHLTREWVAVPNGTAPGPESAVIDAASAHLPAPTGVATWPGRRSSGPNPDAARTLPAVSAAEQEFSIEIGFDAEFGTAYELRVTNAGQAIPGLVPAVVRIAGEPTVRQSAGQKAGARPTATSGAAKAQTSGYALITVTGPGAGALFALSDPMVGPAGTATIHQPFISTRSAECAVCHSTHSSTSQNLVRASSQTDQCYTCHGPGGLGGPMDTQSGFTAAPANDPNTASYFSHDLTAPGHTLGSKEDFAGTLNRHSECSDCHNPHNLTSASDTYSTTTSTWAVGGSYGAVTGVTPVNGAAGSQPTYTKLDGVLSPVTAEYQLCFKCHSGYTTLPTNTSGKPSRDFTDLGREFNPANLSFHPVEAAGKNQTAKMADSLSGTSQYKIWNLKVTDTVRCVMCHTNDKTASTTASNASLDVHASANRGILIRPYEDRLLSTRLTTYNPTGFALCLTCHAETPYMNPVGTGAETATNFMFHGLHVAGIRTKGSGGTDIDTPGAGQGNALCAECHFRSHATTDAVPGQTISGTGLVNFSPNVKASVAMGAGMGGKAVFTKTATGGSCTLTCHGKDHQKATYVG